MGNHNTTDARPQVPDNWDATQIASQKGRIAVVTGANSGIGYDTALELARKGADVVLACRNEGRGRDAEKKLRSTLASVPDAGQVKFMTLDVSDLSSVKAFAEEFKKTHDRLDLLINNAGVMAVPYATTVDGYERQFATNHLGHFALTAQLLPLLKQSIPSRIVNVSSLAHSGATLDRFAPGAEIMWTNDVGYSPMNVYSESKLSNLLFTFELERRLRAQNVTGVTAVACHPGLTGTNLGGTDRGALPTLYAATGSDVEGNDYYGPAKYFEIRGPPKRVKAKPTAHDEPAAKALWKESERLAKLQFNVQ
ncbi:hypothetical protein BBO99_00004365 [Phytophthora kernoviae]|uniref:Short-chain dehydrogenase n=2 Tax=Phytophthora kernoviae TaxID=325452 RepID=A0A3R7J2J4_9STRA|nr:hypothetical protein G195_004892 [Phytophthora kernoviae 00238/432]KAG2521602.1 hypothetical protein JM16_004214 [Phytophthora kernoviae]KAG2523030.1 hypothetical protein JM18_003592 [Phytophthora kernoviae]RLN10801.1 hypothetical protein BBI17_004531 [Phytophthora kernoviae]RLN80630.1 hypothetical protein BBO99_00004365 [Phytophthora kernoviae]